MGNLKYLPLRRISMPRCSLYTIDDDVQTRDLVEQLVTLVSLDIALMRLFSRSLVDLDTILKVGKYSQVEELHGPNGDIQTAKRKVIV